MNTEIFAGVLALSLALSISLADEARQPLQEPASPAKSLPYEEPRILSCAIYDPHEGNNAVLFRFKREASRSGATLKVKRDFTYPDGRLAARERIVYEGDRLVSYALEEVQIGANGSARIKRAANNPAKGSIDFEYTREAGSQPKLSTEALRENTLVADMVGPFLASHWDALERGEKVKCRYIVVPRTETVGFTFVRDFKPTPQRQHVLVVRMEPTSAIVGTLVDPLVFTLEQDPPHRVLQYVGRTTPKIRLAGKWKDLDAVTVFDWNSAR